MSARPSRRNTAPRRGPLRALMHFEALPEAHKTFKAPDDCCGAHLREGEFAVIDTTDRELQHGELYLIQYRTGERQRRIVQTRRSFEQITRPPSPTQEVWWTCDLSGFRPTGGSTHGGIPLFTGLSDGPYEPDGLRSQIAGRVVGYAETHLGQMIAPNAGWEDEEGGNAAFDPAKYLDLLLGTGHNAYVIVDRHGGRHYCEEMPLDPLDKKEWRAVWRAREKFGAASTGRERMIVECVSRGFVRK